MPQLLVRVRFGVRVRDRVRGRVRDRGRNWLRMGTSCVTPGRRVAGPSRRALSPDCRLSALGAGEGLG